MFDEPPSLARPLAGDAADPPESPFAASEAAASFLRCSASAFSRRRSCASSLAHACARRFALARAAACLARCARSLAARAFACAARRAAAIWAAEGPRLR
jgi:hypothetical protein